MSIVLGILIYYSVIAIVDKIGIELRLWVCVSVGSLSGITGTLLTNYL